MWRLRKRQLKKNTMKYILAILSVTAVLAVGFIPSASAEFIYRGDQHKGIITLRYWVNLIKPTTATGTRRWFPVIGAGLK